MAVGEQLAFWAAIRANPLDDTPRLVYADWLQENGTSSESDRAEFIRVQCALWALGSDRRKGRKHRPALEATESALLAKYRSDWIAPFQEVLRGSDRFRSDEWLNTIPFIRGFFDGAHLTLEGAARIARAEDGLEPLNGIGIMECAANYDPDAVTQVGLWVGAGCLIDFSIAGANDGDISAILRPGNVRNLTRLGFWYGKVSDTGIRELASWPYCTGLKYLDLKDNPITDAGAFALADSPYLTNLTRLDLYRTHIGSNGYMRLREKFGERLAIENQS